MSVTCEMLTRPHLYMPPRASSRVSRLLTRAN
jgi:hypothetical protein